MRPSPAAAAVAVLLLACAPALAAPHVARDDDDPAPPASIVTDPAALPTLVPVPIGSTSAPLSGAPDSGLYVVRVPACPAVSKC